jgi:hypothetical protein
MSPQFWVTQDFRITNIFNNHNIILICNKKKLSIKRSILWSRMFLRILIAFCLEKPPSQIATLDGMSTIFLQKLHKFRPICVSFQIASTYAPNFKYGQLVISDWCKCLHADTYMLGGGYGNAHTCHNAQTLQAKMVYVKPVVC